MKQRLTAVLLVLVLLLGGCAAPATDIASIEFQPTELALQDARKQYRSAALVVRGNCIQTHINSDGDPCYDLEVTTVVAGDGQVGDIVHCTSGAMEVGGEYLLYLKQGEDAYHTEDDRTYTLLSDAPLPIGEDSVNWNGTSVPLERLLADIRQQSAIIAAPATNYFYRSLGDLVKNTQQIFIGRVTHITPVDHLAFRMMDDGASIEEQHPASLVTIEAYSSIKGFFTYGSLVTMVSLAQPMGDLLDAQTLSPKSVPSFSGMELAEGATYLFFLNPGTDAKQDYYFPVNTLQDAALLEGESVTAVPGNIPLDVYSKLTPLVQRIRYLLEQEELEEQPHSPSLVIEQ